MSNSASLKAGSLTGKLEGRPCMFTSSGPLLLEAMPELEGGALDWDPNESWDNSWKSTKGEGGG